MLLRHEPDEQAAVERADAGIHGLRGRRRGRSLRRAGRSEIEIRCLPGKRRTLETHARYIHRCKDRNNQRQPQPFALRKYLDHTVRPLAQGQWTSEPPCYLSTFQESPSRKDNGAARWESPAPEVLPPAGDNPD